MDNPALKDQVSLIREVFAYTHRFKKSTFVIKLDSAIIDEPAFPVLARDISLLKGNGIRIILIAGAKERINEILMKYNIQCDFHDGIRITPPEAIPFIKMAAFDTANHVMTALSAYGENAVIGNWVKARALGVQDGLDFLNTGIVEKVDTRTINKLLDENIIPIFPSIGWNSIGIPYNLNSDKLALTIASEMQARKLFYITGDDILTTPPYQTSGSTNISREGRISKMDIRAAKDFLNLNSDIPNRNIIKCAVEASERGVDRVHIVDGRIEGVVLKEIFSSLGSGTMIHTNIYESIRPMKSEDVPAILSLMQPLIEKGLLVKRSREDLMSQKNHFAVYSMDNMIHGCAALIPYGNGYGEIAAIAVDPSYNHLGIGKRLVSFFLDRAREEGLRHIFVLTTEAADWFLSHGFKSVPKDMLPPEKLNNYNNKRNSRILMMDLMS